MQPVAGEHGCKLTGIDYLSIAPYNDSVAPHEILLSNNVVILETLDLRKAEPGVYQLICLPLKLESREAAPCRAILLPTL
jgi:arylformamidase